jgi:hypothetical protein
MIWNIHDDPAIPMFDDHECKRQKIGREPEIRKTHPALAPCLRASVVEMFFNSEFSNQNSENE